LARAGADAVEQRFGPAKRISFGLKIWLLARCFGASARIIFLTLFRAASLAAMVPPDARRCTVLLNGANAGGASLA